LQVYLHPHCFYTSKPSENISFCGYSFPHYNQVRIALKKQLKNYGELEPRKANIRDFLSVHSQEYLKKLILKAQDQLPWENTLDLSIECQGLEYCLPGYLYGLGGMMSAIDQMQKGILERAYCFSMVGHHAHRNQAHGYCLLNPQAAAVRYAQKQGFNRVLIIDWDIHHGDGTQSIFSYDPEVFCISIHNAVDLYMAKVSDLKLGTTTFAEKVGHCNIPVLPYDFPDKLLEKFELTGNFYRFPDIIKVFHNSLANVPFKPDLITIFSGYDSHGKDCGENITNWTNNEFILLTKIVIDFARKFSCPILSVHGGGYQLPVTVSAALAHINTLKEY
jgi:acetoin utilization deacetylase AcuC-like enzyme